MTPGARVAAAIEILDEIAAGGAAEQVLTRWARSHRFAGSGDRAAIRDHVFDVLRRWRSTAAYGGGTTGRSRMIGLLSERNEPLEMIFNGEGHAPPPLTEVEQKGLATAKCAPGDQRDLPDWLWPVFERSLGDDASSVAALLRDRAPVTLRVNLAKKSRSAVVHNLSQEGITAEPLQSCETALNVTSGPRKIRNSKAMSEGWVELQDLSSQIASALVPLPNGTLLDLCAGGGGKSLALADRAVCEGMATDFFVHDIDPERMADLPERARRAGATLTARTTAQLEGDVFDVVLVDAPCTGSGTWRRGPQAKWALTPDRLRGLVQTQAEVLEQASQLTSHGGQIVYMTCSVFDEENGDQIKHFLSQSPAWTCVLERSILPSPEGDGFFIAVLARSETT